MHNEDPPELESLNLREVAAYDFVPQHLELVPPGLLLLRRLPLLHLHQLAYLVGL